MNEEKEIVPVEAEERTITPIVTPENAKAAMQAYQELCSAVLIPWDRRKTENGVIVQESDYQRIPVRRKEGDRWITEYKDFPKKSAWRKLGKFYKISDEIVGEPMRVEREDGSFVWRYRVKAIAPDGQYTFGIGSCDSKEIYDERRREHDTESKAHTRAKNRAISDLIGFGQVSAEEMTGEPKYVESKQTEVKPSKEKPEVSDEAQPDQREVYPSPEKLNTPTWDFADDIAMQGWEAVDGIIEAYLSDMGYQKPTEAFEFGHDVAKAWVRNAPGVYLGDAFKEVDTILKIAGFRYNRNEKRWRYAKPEKPSAKGDVRHPPSEEPEKSSEPEEEPAEEPAVPPEEPSEETPPQEKEPPQGPPRSVEDVTERIAASLPGWSELVTVSEYEDYYRVGRRRTLDPEIENHLDFLVSEMGGEWDKEKVAWVIPKEAEG